MKSYWVDWDDLDIFQKEMAIEQYRWIRECEEGKLCSWERAKEETPNCTKFEITELDNGDKLIYVNI